MVFSNHLDQHNNYLEEQGGGLLFIQSYLGFRVKLQGKENEGQQWKENLKPK